MAQDLNIPLGILLAAIAYAALYLGKGVQKYALVGYTQEGVSRGEKGKNAGIWMIGLILTGSFMFIHLFALRYALISHIAPIEGFGLIILCLFSYFILKEPIDRTKSIGIILIIIGLIITAIFMTDPETVPTVGANFILTFSIVLAAIMGFFTILGLYSKSNNYIGAGLIFGSFAGTFMCFQTLTKRITWIEGYWYFVFIMFGFAAATLIMTNFGFLKADAVVVVPSFTAMSIALPTVLALFLFNEIVKLEQWIGICIIILGIILVTAFSSESETKPSNKFDQN